MRRKLKKLLQRRKSELDSKQEAELNKTLQRHEKDHILCPFIGLNPEYMEMSESKQEIVKTFFVFCVFLFTNKRECVLTRKE